MSANVKTLTTKKRKTLLDVVTIIFSPLSNFPELVRVVPSNPVAEC